MRSTDKRDRHPPAGDDRQPAAAGADPDLIQLLHARGQRATPQRLVILRELRRRGRHCTADQIGRSIRRDLPGVSTPTVYATLELLVDLGLARRVDAGAGPTLYDPRVDAHPHTVCNRCGRIDDLDYVVAAGPLLAAASERGFAGDSVEAVVSGRCSDCAGARPASSKRPPLIR
jgi:Fe2+ or Zn2+ uptake regulation protein